jgi:hypothetical protein
VGQGAKIKGKDRWRVPAGLVVKFKAATEQQGPARSSGRGRITQMLK